MRAGYASPRDYPAFQQPPFAESDVAASTNSHQKRTPQGAAMSLEALLRLTPTSFPPALFRFLFHPLRVQSTTMQGM